MTSIYALDELEAYMFIHLDVYVSLFRRLGHPLISYPTKSIVDRTLVYTFNTKENNYRLQLYASISNKPCVTINFYKNDERIIDNLSILRHKLEYPSGWIILDQPTI